ncbi:uncharacterized protein PHACADRAFT_206341 [Phanerochaete carnosa HHB-10118-sp]|uniref:Uncharacterized protein n=1 Tax=Phanerochaete carnosa (strain HHB-10118-sp) TaxID=650164 RepID=K5WED0_PHACS|nr:uncharacterized protein PHACADRAFT_206341 [Phanerochaete carnosa HHB-10118-sp]EKM57414.1 hypothetical protein PHACADRAFT_206341 [Phanerochaete carnosa HHB-10118-sp]
MSSNLNPFSPTGSSPAATINEVYSADPTLVYHGDWYLGNMSSNPNETTYGTRSTGANVTFIFNGTFIAAYGTIDNTGVDLMWTLDDATPIRYTMSPQSPAQYRSLFLNVQPPDDRKHKLVIASASDGPTLWLDYLTFTGTKDVPPLGGNVTSSSTPAGTARAERIVPPGIIASAAVGGVLFLALAVACAVLLVRRKHRLTLERPRKDVAFRQLGVGMLPDDHEKNHHMVEAMRIKILGALRSPSRTNPGAATQAALSSTIFTSVIFNVPSSVAASQG